MPRIALFAGGDLTEFSRDFDFFVGVAPKIGRASCRERV
mgnify:CR=1 FL=1